ncbi:MAG TPA: response regulator transcription factor [Nocardioides sp.]|uniref:response regulator transcription factor n=1 Tax=Nocardioides sp. TaxID=35761 RepID=UPI002D7E8CFE|nr:response regulator transcription factor [Nocardioides sp.]HET6654448.1 response regulator transcription factor [Nocardioides sp.]
MTETRPAARTRVLLVDDHPTVLLGLRAVLSAAGIEVVAAVTSGEKCLRVLDEEAPDVVVLDLGMPGRGGLETLRLIREAAPRTAVLVLTASADTKDVSEAVRLGASGYLLKDTEAEQLVAGVLAASRGDAPLDPRVARYVIRNVGTPAPKVVLTRREHDVLGLLQKGFSNKLIAERLGIQEKTVKAYLSSIYAHIGVHERTSAAIWARHNLEDVFIRR